ncbi:MAG: hypothetical protein ACOCXR_00910 [Phototrophicaceae bacterium]
MTEDREEARQRALQTLDFIRDALVGSDIQEAVRQIDVLQNQLVDWKRAAAREWLDKALNADLLLFNIDAARQRLNQWANTLEDAEADPDLARYRSRVVERTRLKHLELQARGVVAHCNELWRQASTLERDDSPPHPDSLLESHYRVAYEVAQSAQMEYPDNHTLADLLERAQRMYNEKQSARDLYTMAIEEDRYADALDLIEALETIELLPRFRVVSSAAGDETQTRTLVFSGMVSLDAAYTEIESLGRRWANAHVAQMLQAVHDHLTAFRPQAALDLLASRKRIEHFAEAPIRDKLHEFEQRASDDLRRLQQAERRAQQALHIIDDNLISAWDIYMEAYSLYRGAPSLGEARSAILSEMLADLERRVVEAEDAFNNRMMERIGQIYQAARLDYSDRAPELEERLARLEELDWQARTFTEYRRSAVQMLDRMRGLVVEDVSAAAEMLAKLEEYPVLVLEDLPGLVDVRAAIRRRLNQEMLYNRLYKLLHTDSIEEVEQGIAEAMQQSDARFDHLLRDLETHLTYLSGHVEYAVGQMRQAMGLFEQVAAHEGHPDQAEAERLSAEIREILERPPSEEE